MDQPNLFDTAVNYSKRKPQYFSSEHRANVIRELMLILENAPLMGRDEKEQIKKLIPVLSDTVLENIKNTLIRQGLRLLNYQNNA